MFAKSDHAFRRRSASSTPSRSIIINVVSWVLLALVISTLVARFAMKLSRRIHGKIVLRDMLLVAAAVSIIWLHMMGQGTDDGQLFSFGQTIAVSLQWKDDQSERHLQSSYDDSLYQKACCSGFGLFCVVDSTRLHMFPTSSSLRTWAAPRYTSACSCGSCLRGASSSMHPIFSSSSLPSGQSVRSL